MGGRIVETKAFKSEDQRWRESVSEKIVVPDQWFSGINIYGNHLKGL